MPETQVIYFKDGTTAEMATIDARRALQEHSDEWSTKPFPASQQVPPEQTAADLVEDGKWRKEGVSEEDIATKQKQRDAARGNAKAKADAAAQKQSDADAAAAKKLADDQAKADADAKAAAANNKS